MTAPVEELRIARRVRHAEGGGALGTFQTTGDVAAFTRAGLFQLGARVDVLVRFSRTLGFRGGPDSWRDLRGFAVKFLTAEGDYDLAGNNSPVFFLRDDAKFASLVKAQHLGNEPGGALYDYDRLWAFYTRHPETAHQVAWLFGDRGIPYSWRHQDGFGAHTFSWENRKGERFWVRYHLRTEQGNAYLTDAEAAAIPTPEVDYYRDDLRASIDHGEHPAWELAVQIMPSEAAASAPFNPFDVTKVWPKSDYPLVTVGRLVLDRNPDDETAQIEQAGFSPANFVPGIGPSPDPMLRARVIGYPTFHRHRILLQYQRGSSAAQGTSPAWPEPIGEWATDDFSQASALVRTVLDDAARARLAATVALHLQPVIDPALRRHALDYWRQIDAVLAARVEAQL